MPHAYPRYPSRAQVVEYLEAYAEHFGLVPRLDTAAALEVTAIHSVAGTLPPQVPLLMDPPFLAPHHTATKAAIVGGGSGVIRPGSASLAHRGVLFLDEARDTLFAPRNRIRHGRS